jgi:hypothetical protein
MLRPVVARRIAAGVIAAFASALSRRMGWGPLPWQRSSSLGESKANSTGGKASLGEMLLAKLRFWKRESSSIPSGWSVVVDKDNSVLQEWFFLLYHARTRTRIEVTGHAQRRTYDALSHLASAAALHGRPGNIPSVKSTGRDSLLPLAIPGAIRQCRRRAGADWAWRTNQEGMA